MSVFLGVMTTAHVRMMLYNFLVKLQQYVIYTDTESIIVTSLTREWIPPLGPFMGNQ